MSIWPRPMQREVPITDPRWLASTQPDRELEPKPDVHWRVMQGLNVFNVCGATDGPANISAALVTCPGCLTTVVRAKCFAPDPEDRIGLGIVCEQKVGADGTHEGLHDWQGRLTSPLDERERAQARDTPSGVLPVRVPGAALGGAGESSEVRVPVESERPAESNVEREVLETWTA